MPGHLKEGKEKRMGVRFELITFHGEPAIIFEDGDIVLQKDSLGEFLMHVSILMPNCELPDKLEIRKEGNAVAPQG